MKRDMTLSLGSGAYSTMIFGVNRALKQNPKSEAPNPKQTPQTLNPKSEYRKRPRGPKQNRAKINPKSGKSKTSIPIWARLGHSFVFNILNLFRISSFEFVIVYVLGCKFNPWLVWSK